MAIQKERINNNKKDNKNKDKDGLKDKERKVLTYINRVCKQKSRPTIITTNWIAFKVGLTYKQARRIIDKLVRLNLVDKWTTPFRMGREFRRISRYRRKKFTRFKFIKKKKGANILT